MNIHEYQAKKILKDFGAPVSNGVVIFSCNEIIDSLQLSSMENDWLTKLEKLFTISDLVKFAKQIPTENENISAISTVRELIVNERSDVMQKEES